MEWTIPAFAFPAEAGTHLPTPEGWKAELALAKNSLAAIAAYRKAVRGPVLYVLVLQNVHFVI